MLFIIPNVYADDIDKTPSLNYKFSTYDYVIDKYDINIIVNENNTLDITETITAFFNVPKHGIYRTIPLKNTITRLDGTESKNNVQITNVSVDNEFTTSNEDDNLKIKIGSANQTLTGEQKYTIKYLYNLGKDHIKDYDELYYNIIGSEWDTAIGNITFTIKMPKDYDESKLGFSSGELGSTDNSKINYTVNGNIITGNYDGILDKGNALTVRCQLDNGYFINAGFPIKTSSYLIFIVPILCVIFSLLIWYKYGKDDPVIETVEFYPPEGFNSLEVGYLYKGKATNEDVTSLIVYLANKGYLKISEIEENNLFSKSKNFMLTKLKDYDGKNDNEEMFFDGLFSGQRNNVTSNDLYDSFYKTMNKILENINNKENKNKIFEKTPKINYVLIILLMIISFLTTITIPSIEYGNVSSLLLTIFVTLFYIPFYAVGIFSNMSKGIRIFWLGFTIFHSVCFFSILPIAKAATSSYIYFFGVLVGIICLGGIFILLRLMPKRNKYGNQILGKIKGFKNFLETAEKDKLEAMVMQDPGYFYNILPFTYVLGVSDKWINNFETISLKAPDWYDSSSSFDVMSFSSFMGSTMISCQSAMSSCPSSSSSGGSSFGGGGSSGGGSSGGGSGGGGGGSW
jgi:uncharacterized membrane protein YgcG